MELHSHLHRYPISTITDHQPGHQAQDFTTPGTVTIDSPSYAQSYLSGAQILPAMLQSNDHTSNLGSASFTEGTTISGQLSKSLHQLQSYSRWLPSARSPEADQFLSSMHSSRLSNSDFQSHGGEVSNSLQPSISGAGNLDISINLGLNKQGSSVGQESNTNFGSYRSSFSNTGPLMSPITPGLSSLLDHSNNSVPQQLSGYGTGQFNSGLVSPNIVSNGSLHNSPLAGVGASAAVRLHEYEAPSPRMVLWDFQDN